MQKMVNGEIVVMSDDEIAARQAEEAAEVKRLTELAWARLRAERNARLAACDWTQLPDAGADAAAWATYRQALRDLPAKTGDPLAPVWPTPPG